MARKGEKRVKKFLTLKENKIIEQYRKTGYLSQDANEQKLKSEIVDYKNKYKIALEEIKTLNKKLNIINQVEKEDIKYYKYEYSKGKKNESIAFAIASDWHIEEKVDPETVNNLNNFNLEIGKKRTELFFRNTLKLIESQRNSNNINVLVLALLGDMINGYIHDENIEENYLSPTQSLLYIKQLICSGIDYLLNNGNLKKIIIPCSIGNHGRTTRKPMISSAAKNSYEWLMYNIISDNYKNNKKVEFLVGLSYHTYFNAFDKYLIRFHHGDAIRYSGGVGGITIPVNKAINQWNKTERAYLDVFGHYHQLFDGGNFICNGSLIGYNAYAIKIKAPFQQPLQSFFLIDKQRGKTITSPIFVEEPKNG